MTQAHCRHCGGQVDERIATCPHCAAAQPLTPTSPAAPASTYRQLGSDIAIALYMLGSVGLVVWLNAADDFGDRAIGGLILANAVIAPMLAETLSQREAPAVQDGPPIGTVAPAPPTGAVGLGWRLFRWGVNLVSLTALAALIAFSDYWFFDEDDYLPKAPAVMALVSFLIAPPLAFLIRHTVTVALHEALRWACEVMLWMVPALCLIVLDLPESFIGLPLTYFAGCYRVASCRDPGLKVLLAIPLFLACVLGPTGIIIQALSASDNVELSPDGH